MRNAHGRGGIGGAACRIPIPPSGAAANCQNCGGGVQKPTGTQPVGAPLSVLPVGGWYSAQFRRSGALRTIAASNEMQARTGRAAAPTHMEAHMFRRFGFVLIAALVVAVPAAAQDRPVQVTIGGGYTAVLGAASDKVGSGGNFTLGVFFKTGSWSPCRASTAGTGCSRNRLKIQRRRHSGRGPRTDRFLRRREHAVWRAQRRARPAHRQDGALRDHRRRRLLPPGDDHYAGARLRHDLRPLLVRVLPGRRPGRAGRR